MGDPEHTVVRPVLREQLRERILQRILDGEFAPGDRIVENRLTKEYGVSQAPVREALRDLEAMRFVQSEPHRGVRVRRVSHKEIGEMYPVRAALEEVAGRAAAPLVTDELLARLEEQLDRLRGAVADQDVPAQLRHDARFHELIVEAAGNTLLLEVWRSLHAEVRTLITYVVLHSSQLNIVEAHRPIVEALRRRDPDLAGKEMRDHIEHFGALVMDAAAD